MGGDMNSFWQSILGGLPYLIGGGVIGGGIMYLLFWLDRRRMEALVMTEEWINKNCSARERQAFAALYCGKPKMFLFSDRMICEKVAQRMPDELRVLVEKAINEVARDQK
jgi:hypothetical protein